YAVQEFKEQDLKGIREIENRENLGAVAPKVLGAAQVMGRQVLLMGVDFPVELPLKTWWHLDGAAPAASEDLLVGAEAATALHLAIGDTLPLGSRTFTVTAILQPTGAAEDGMIIGDLHAVQEVLGKKGIVSLVEIAAFCRDCPITELVLQIAEKFPNAKVTALRQAVMAKMQSIELFKAFSYGVAGLVIFIGSLLVFVTMMGAVNERTREIGIFRAIGFRRGHVMQIILLEAIVVGFVGGFMGFAGGNLIAWSILPVVIPSGTFAGANLPLGGLAILLSISLSLLASLYPARKGSSLDPSEALRAL
ncbi:MAG: ABC transporter permease, partial [Desulfurivibrionaceae bacterium]